MTVLRLGGGLLLLLAANIALGTLNAVMAGAWNRRTFLGGLVKAAVVTAAFAAVYCAGRLNPDLVVIEVGGRTVDLGTAVYLVLLAGYVCYGTKVLKKLKFILTKQQRDEPQTARPREEGGEGALNEATPAAKDGSAPPQDAHNLKKS